MVSNRTFSNTLGEAARWVGVVVEKPNGDIPGLPFYLSRLFIKLKIGGIKMISQGLIKNVDHQLMVGLLRLITSTKKSFFSVYYHLPPSLLLIHLIQARMALK